MKKLLLWSVITVSMIAFSGCANNIAPMTKAKSACVGCENLPDCVPGPYGDCLPKKR